MFMNGRPYTNENGHIDDGLITEQPEAVIEAVSGWIRKNIRPARRILQGRTSYGLKHLLERDTGIYLTNNEFKDALFLAGYRPVNADELNWRYRIELIRECNDNPSPFFRWATKNYGKANSPLGDFAKDMLHDVEFPVFSEEGVIKDYLCGIGACDGAIEAFEELWRLYEREVH